MTHKIHGLLIVAAVFTFSFQTVEAQIWGDRPSTSVIQQRITEINRLLPAGEKALKEALNQAEPTRREHQRCEVERRQCLREISLARRAAEEAVKNSPETATARNKVNELQARWTALEARRVETLQQSNAEYQSLLQSLVRAKERRTSSTTMASEDRQTLAKQIAGLERKRRDLEEIDLAHNKEATTLKLRLKDAEGELAARVKKNAETVENDARLVSAKAKFRRISEELNTAQLKLSQAEANVNRIRSNLQTLVANRTTLESQLREMTVGIRMGGTRTSSGKLIGSASCGRCGRSVSITATRCHNCGVVFQGTAER